MGTSSTKTQLLGNAAHNQSQRKQSAGQREALAARRGLRVRAGGVVMGRGPGLAVAAVLAVIVCGCLAARADAFVYWANADTIGRANLDGSGVNQNLLGVGLGLWGVAADGQYVYWTNDGAGAIGRANPNGSGANQSFITGARIPMGVAVDAHHIYWTNFAGDTIGRANLDGSGVDQSFITGVAGPMAVAVDGQHVYWTNIGYGAIGRANLDGSGVNQGFITGATAPTGVAVDAQHVYWANSDNNTIGRANVDGSSVDQSFITGADTSAVADDGQHLYWANRTFDTIARANLDGSGREESFVTGVQHVFGVAVDGLPLAPLASITTPASGATYTVGQAVDSSFTCQEGAGGPGIASCVDPNGDGSGAAIDTSATGPHTFTITATSNDGQRVTASVSYTVVAPKPPTPVLGDLRESHARWREGRAPAQIASHEKRTARAPAVGTTFSFTLNQPATVKLTFTKHAAGRVATFNGHRECVAPTTRNQQRRTCTRALNAGNVSLNAPGGADQIVFAGRVNPRHKLSLGSYTVTITATNDSGESSTPRSLRFTIVK